MIRKIFCIFMAIALCMCLCACGQPSSGYNRNTLFERVQSYNDCQVYRHIETNVLYVYFGHGFTALVNADGTPMVWNGH